MISHLVLWPHRRRRSSLSIQGDLIGPLRIRTIIHIFIHMMRVGRRCRYLLLRRQLVHLREWLGLARSIRLRLPARSLGKLRRLILILADIDIRVRFHHVGELLEYSAFTKGAILRRLASFLSLPLNGCNRPRNIQTLRSIPVVDRHLALDALNVKLAVEAALAIWYLIVDDHGIDAGLQLPRLPGGRAVPTVYVFHILVLI